jgi:hypothetical protein
LGLAADANIIRIGSGQTNTFIAGVINGNGGGLTNVNAATATTAANVTGNIADDQLSANIPLLDGTNNFSGIVNATNVNNVFTGTFTGSGAALTNLSASAITGGITTNILVGGHTFYITNGLIMNIQ